MYALFKNDKKNKKIDKEAEDSYDCACHLAYLPIKKLSRRLDELTLYQLKVLSKQLELSIFSLLSLLRSFNKNKE